MRIDVLACNLPHRQGTAAGQDLWAWCEGMRGLGHQVTAWLWSVSPSSPDVEAPAWSRWVTFDPETARSNRTVPLPGEGWDPAGADVVLADHLPSAPGVSCLPNAVVTLHLRTFADAVAGRRFTGNTLHDLRAERRARRGTALLLAYSERVLRGARAPAAVVPIAVPQPDAFLEPTDEPVATLTADWWWPPNKVALRRLLAMWPDVHERVPQARLLLAGRHLEDLRIPALPGVVPIGEVRDKQEVLARSGILAFPCPGSSGPKVKVLEALAHGIPALTTRAGVEGLRIMEGEGVVVAGRHDFARRLAALLADPARRCELGHRGRQRVLIEHSGVAAARARVSVFGRILGIDTKLGVRDPSVAG